MRSLRELFAEEKQQHLDKYGKIDWQWTDEGSAWVIQDYYGGKGSLLNFTEDDFTAAADEGWSRELVAQLCKEEGESLCSD